MFPICACKVACWPKTHGGLGCESMPLTEKLTDCPRTHGQRRLLISKLSRTLYFLLIDRPVASWRLFTSSLCFAKNRLAFNHPCISTA